MSKLSYPLLAAALMLAACHHENTEAKPVSQQAKMPKPTIAIAEAIDSSGHSTDWSLSDEVTYSLYQKLAQNDRLAVCDPQKIKSITRKLKSGDDPFGGDLQWVKRAFRSEDFVVFCEVLKHEEVPASKEMAANPQNSAANLLFTCRVIVVDLRDQNPTIILQEIASDSYFIPRQFNKYNLHQEPWGSPDFINTPMGMAHKEFFQDISSRISDYITLSYKG
jgi:hypothetical protein